MSKLSKFTRIASYGQYSRNVRPRIVNFHSTNYLIKSNTRDYSSNIPSLRSILTLPTNRSCSTFVSDDYETMPVFEDADLLSKLLEYSYIHPRPLSIEEMIECGGGVEAPDAAWNEEEGFRFLKKELAVRIAHLIMELQNLPKDMRTEESCGETITKYCTTFQEVMEFEDMEASDEALQMFREKLFAFRRRHRNADVELGQCCKAMACKIVSLEENEYTEKISKIRKTLDKFFTSRISIHMITNHHLKVFGNDRVQFNDVGQIRPNCDIRSVLEDAVSDVTGQVENDFMAAPKVDIKIYKNAKEINEPVFGDLVPEHLSTIFKEILRNSMRATVEHHFHDLENLPPVSAIICQADDEFTIKISDCGGGMDRDSAKKCFMYDYSTPSKYSDAELPGNGLPRARLYARYFHGDIKMASYEGYGTDIYIYLKAVGNVAKERLPLFNKENKSDRKEDDKEEDKWDQWDWAYLVQDSKIKTEKTQH